MKRGPGPTPQRNGRGPCERERERERNSIELLSWILIKHCFKLREFLIQGLSTLNMSPSLRRLPSSQMKSMLVTNIPSSTPFSPTTAFTIVDPSWWENRPGFGETVVGHARPPAQTHVRPRNLRPVTSSQTSGKPQPEVLAPRPEAWHAFIYSNHGFGETAAGHARPPAQQGRSCEMD